MELLAFVADVLDELDIRREVEYVKTIPENGTSTDRQLSAFHRTGDLEAVVDELTQQTEEGWEATLFNC